MCTTPNIRAKTWLVVAAREGVASLTWLRAALFVPRREARGLISLATTAGDFMASVYDDCTNEEHRALAAYTVDV